MKKLIKDLRTVNNHLKALIKKSEKMVKASAKIEKPKMPNRMLFSYGCDYWSILK
jgi:hypothetical protein